MSNLYGKIDWRRRCVTRKPPLLRTPTMTSIRTWCLSLLRPKVTRVKVRLWENGKLIEDFSKYPQHKLIPLMKSLNELWATPFKSPYWFETEVYETNPSCCSREKPVTLLYVCCYRESLSSNEFRMKAQIPGRYMKKMLDKRHRVIPEQIGYTQWPELVEVKFVLDK